MDRFNRVRTLILFGTSTVIESTQPSRTKHFLVDSVIIWLVPPQSIEPIILALSANQPSRRTTTFIVGVLSQPGWKTIPFIVQVLSQSGQRTITFTVKLVQPQKRCRSKTRHSLPTHSSPREIQLIQSQHGQTNWDKRSVCASICQGMPHSKGKSREGTHILNPVFTTDMFACMWPI